MKGNEKIYFSIGILAISPLTLYCQKYYYSTVPFSLCIFFSVCNLLVYLVYEQINK